ncbi:MAG: prepilin-type N-terminal cleavage/methylation domain-containing protein [Myxococcales bacterium]|nr:prepilin-type N-terminal cleavage/methylation domain-containing protein [Myxococcales bacterium]
MHVPRSSRKHRGVTLIEVMIAAAISLILTAAAIGFATQETRLMDVSQQRLEMAQVGRASLALLAEDIRKAGAGVGYDEEGRFQGVLANTFTYGGLTWNGSGTPIVAAESPPFSKGVHRINDYTRPKPGATRGKPYSVMTHDIGFMYADGAYATVVKENNYRGQVCDKGLGSMFSDGELVILRDFSGISALSGRISISLASSGVCNCISDCDDFLFTPTTDFNSGPGADSASYGLGEIQGGLKTVLWFVAEVDGEGQLRRVQFDGNTNNCVDRRSCGGLVADFAEALYTQIWRWNTTTNSWEQAGQGPNTETTDRMRIDVELILRSESESDGRKPMVQTKLQVDNCIPGTCGQPSTDGYIRNAYRTTVEIMNAGFMRLRSGR